MRDETNDPQPHDELADGDHGSPEPPIGRSGEALPESRGDRPADTPDAAAARRRAIARGAPRPFEEDERESAYGLLQRGLALAQRRHNAQAAVVLARAAAMEPGRGSILEALGRAYYNSGQVERARETFEQLLEVDPSSHYGHYALGQSLKRLGQREAAGTHLRMAAALDPTSKLYRFALARLPEQGTGGPAGRLEMRDDRPDEAAGSPDTAPGDATPDLDDQG